MASSIREQTLAMERQNDVLTWQTQIATYQQLATQPGQDPEFAKMMINQVLELLRNPPRQAEQPTTPNSISKGDDASAKDISMTSVEDDNM